MVENARTKERFIRLLTETLFSVVELMKKPVSTANQCSFYLQSIG